MRIEKEEARAVGIIFRIFIVLAAITLFAYEGCNGQKLKDYIPSVICTFIAGSSDGLRDASMFRMDGYSQWMNGKQSWTNKWKNHDIKQGPAFWGSTSIFVFTTDLAHASNLVTHQVDGMSMILMPQDNNKRFWHLMAKVAVIDIVRSLGHYTVYDLIFKPQGRD